MAFHEYRRPAIALLSILATTAVAASARADSLQTGSSTCAMLVQTGTASFSKHIGVYGTNASGQSRLYIAFNDGSWHWYTPPSSIIRTTQLACGAAGAAGQGILAYRDGSSNVKAIDRLGGWVETSLGLSSAEYGMWGVATPDLNTTKFALFVPKEDGHLWMVIRNESATPKWGSPRDLGAIPDGVALTSYLSGYAEMIGPDASNYKALVSVFFVSNAGTLIENKGYIDGTARTFINHGSPSATRKLSSATGWAPGAMAWVADPVSNIPESEYAQRVVVPAFDGSGTYTYVRGQFKGGGWSWQIISPPSATNLAAVATSCGHGFCPIARTIGIAGSPAIFWRNDAGALDGGTWTASTIAANVQMFPSVLGFSAYFVQSTTNLATFDTSTSTFPLTNIGHP